MGLGRSTETAAGRTGGVGVLPVLQAWGQHPRRRQRPKPRCRHGRRHSGPAAGASAQAAGPVRDVFRRTLPGRAKEGGDEVGGRHEHEAVNLDHARGEPLARAAAAASTGSSSRRRSAATAGTFRSSYFAGADLGLFVAAPRQRAAPRFQARGRQRRRLLGRPALRGRLARETWLRRRRPWRSATPSLGPVGAALERTSE
mmetsp:Transcript_78015/g.253141  ORF Transcript_78015/g.253141 Transcript_78015/m.253141 type:complete len:200 (+) Transcript_78015:1860-2459(+)